MMEPQLIMKLVLEPEAGGQMDGQRGTHTIASTKSISIGLLALGLPKKTKCMQMW